MATNITLRSVKGSGLTNDEIDANFAALKATADAAGGGGTGAFAGITGAPTDNAALSTALSYKADSTATSAALASKADSTATAAALASKADSSATTAALAAKAPTGHGHGVASTTAAGFMTATDKLKLDLSGSFNSLTGAPSDSSALTAYINSLIAAAMGGVSAALTLDGTETLTLDGVELLTL